LVLAVVVLVMELIVVQHLVALVATAAQAL
jgi:hypothetical protein